MKSVLFFLTFALISFFGFAQYPNVMITDQGVSVSEPSISMNPRNTDKLLAGSNLWHYFYSIDGGWNWTQGNLTSSENGVWGDPCIIADTAGDFYFLHLANPQNGSWIDRIVSQKFDATSEEWTYDSYMGLNGNKAQDKEWAVVDSATNTIYVTWTQFDEYGTDDPAKFSNILFSKSTDAGFSWAEPVQINQVSGDCIDSDNTTEGAVPAVGTNGEIYVAWAGPAGIVFDRSVDGGQTWLDEDIFINDQPGGWDYDISGINRCNGLPITCCDISQSPYRGTIYVNWSDQRNGTNDTDVWLSKSTDGGNTWTEAKRVNDDEPGKQQFFTWMTVDLANGDLYFVFYDRRNYENNNTDVYLARSTDGGETFENILISESPFLPSSSVFFGDYTNITAFNKQVRPIWARAEGVNMSIWTAIIDMTVGINSAKELIPFSLEQNFPNPFRETTFFPFKLNEQSEVSLTVYDVFGRKVVTLINAKRDAGKYVEMFDNNLYNLKPGAYYFTLQSGNKIQKQKMLLLD